MTAKGFTIRSTRRSSRAHSPPPRPAVPGARRRRRRRRLPGVTTLTMGRRPRPSTEPMTAPPMTSVGWWARRWTRLAATAAAKADVGRRLGVGVRRGRRPCRRRPGCGRSGSCCSRACGRRRRDGRRAAAARRRLDHPAHDQRGEPGGAERHHGPAPVRPAPACLEAGQDAPRRARSRPGWRRRRRHGRCPAGPGGARRRRRPPRRGCSRGPVTRRRRGRTP